MNKQSTIQKPEHSHEYGEQIAVLRSDIDRLQGDFLKLSREVAEDASERLHDFGERAHQKLRENGERFMQASERGRRIAKAEVKRHPFASVLAATGAGIALGALAIWAQNGTEPES